MVVVGSPQRYSPEFSRMRELFFPEERRHEFTTEPWDGMSFRHCRNPKIICLRRISDFYLLDSGQLSL